MAYDKEELKKQIIEYVKEKTQDGSWVQLSSKELAKVLNIGSTSAYCFISTLTSLPELEHRVSERSNTQKKPYEYRYIKKDTENKEEVVVKRDSIYRNLSEAQVKEVREKLIKKQFSDTNITVLLKIINTLASLRTKDEFITNHVKKLSDLLIMSCAQIRLYMKILHDNEMVEYGMHENLIKLTLENSSYIEIKEIKSNLIPEKIASNKIIESNRKVEQVEKDPVETKIAPVKVEVKTDTTNNQTLSEDDKDEFYNMLIDNMKDFKGFVNQFQEFWTNSTAQLEGIGSKDDVEALKQENERLKEHMNKSADAANKAFDLNNKLKNTTEEQELYIKSLKKNIAAFKLFNEELFNFMQEQFQMTIAQATNEISRFTQIPQWKLTQSDRAKFQNNLIGIITSTMDEVVKFNKKGKE